MTSSLSTFGSSTSSTPANVFRGPGGNSSQASTDEVPAYQSQPEEPDKTFVQVDPTDAASLEARGKNRGGSKGDSTKTKPDVGSALEYVTSAIEGAQETEDAASRRGLAGAAAVGMAGAAAVLNAM